PRQRRQVQFFAQHIGKTHAFARLLQFGTDLLGTAVWQPVQYQPGLLGLLLPPLAQGRAQGIYQAAFNTVTGDNKLTGFAFSTAVGGGYAEADMLDRSTGKTLAQVVTPGQFKPTVTGLQGRDGHAGLLQYIHPAAIGAEFRPAGTAQRQYHGAETLFLFAVRSPELPAQSLFILLPANPALARVKHNPLLAQSLQPAAQQRGGFHIGGKHPARAANKGVDA